MSELNYHSKCPFCNSDELDRLKKLKLTKDKFASCLSIENLDEKHNEWFKCRQCDLRFSSINMSRTTQVKLYKNYRTLYNSSSSPKEYFEKLDSLPETKSENAAKINLLVESLRKFDTNIASFNNILDCGCGAGNMLYKIGTLYPNLNCHGFEPTAEFARFASSILNNNVKNSYIEEYNSKIKFDLITLFHVFEHLLIPFDSLIKLIKLLSKSGYIYIVVPSIMDFELIDDYHERFMIQHTYYYSKKFMNNLVQKTKLKLLDTKENISIRGKSDTHFLFKIMD